MTIVFYDDDDDDTADDIIEKDALSIDAIIGYSILTANKFKQLPTYITIDSESKLYVNQGEIISNVHHSEFDIIGSDDATTCLIIIIKDQDGFLSVAHIDDSCIDSYISKITVNDDDVIHHARNMIYTYWDPISLIAWILVMHKMFNLSYNSSNVYHQHIY